MSTSMNNAIIVNGGREPQPKHAYVYHMTWDAIQVEQPDKVPVLERWFKAIGKRPHKYGTLVFDATDKMVYVSAALSYVASDREYVKTHRMVINCIESGAPFRPYKRAEGLTPWDQHRFIAVEDTPIVILEDALEQYEEMERKSYDKARAYDALEKALAEAKELLK